MVLLAILPLLVLLPSWRLTDAFSPPPSSVRIISSYNNNRHHDGRRTILFSSAATTPSSSSSPQQQTAGSPLPEGITKTITVEGIGRTVRAGDVVIVKYFCNTVGSERAFARSDRQRIIACDGTMIRGWDAAIRTMREGERATVHISNPGFAYGAEGVPPFVPSNAEIEIDLEVLNVEDSVGLGGASGSDAAGLDAIMDGPVNRPRTPGAIAAAYEQRMRDKALYEPPEREGLEGWIDKIKGSYFFGLFEGETGQEAPWYLKPSITFPIAFLVVGLAFAASLLGGAISERGMPSTDELDEIIISSTMLQTSVSMALNNMIQV